RLNVIPLHVPPLRERKEDISLLIRDFIEDYARENGTERKAVTPRVIERLEAWNWPGNVRELKNTVERLLILSPGPVIESLDPVMGAAFGSLAPEVPGDIMAPRPFREAKADFERAFIKARLEEHGWNVTQTAEAIDMDRTSLHKKMKSLGLNEERE
ncbi:MAG: sigma-54-dependent Fis family transcriptional regulator, partial [Proteobacteria bacterium]|nr:sigma-54-dependent Fis family transcriptional regulator [Pseudomonadota bacterium]